MRDTREGEEEIQGQRVGKRENNGVHNPAVILPSVSFIYLFIQPWATGCQDGVGGCQEGL